MIEVPTKSEDACVEPRKASHILEACSPCQQMATIREELREARRERAREWIKGEVATGRLPPPFTEQQIQENCRLHIETKLVEQEQEEYSQLVDKLVRGSRQDATSSKVTNKKDMEPIALPTITLTPPSPTPFHPCATEFKNKCEQADSKRLSHKRQRSSLSNIVKGRGLTESSRLGRIVLAQELEKLNVATPYTPAEIAENQKKMVERQGEQAFRPQSQFRGLDQGEEVENATRASQGIERSTIRRPNEADSARLRAKCAADEAAAMSWLC